MATRDRSGHRVLIDGQQIRLARLVKSGGAGSIYLLADRPDSVVKLYHPSIDRAEYAEKISAMLKLRPKLEPRSFSGRQQVQIAWPSAPVLDSGRRFIGFAMPLLDLEATCELEVMLQARQAEAAGLNPSLGVKMTLAANLATVVAALHHEGHYVVDMKPVNLSFYRDSLYIALLDCDGFSIRGRTRRFPAGQFTPDYLAPEFQGLGVRAGDGQSQDLFALAVIVFRLLNFGIHPFTGRPKHDKVPTDIPSRIRHWHYAYGQTANPLIAPSPISGHEAMPATLRELFDRAFTGTDRPSAADWAKQFTAYARRDAGLLIVCDKKAEHQHFKGLPCASCAREDMLARAKRSSSQRRRTRQRRRQQTRRQTRAHARTRTKAGSTSGGTTTARTTARTTNTARPGALATLVTVVAVVVVVGLMVKSCTSTDTPTPENTARQTSSPVERVQPKRDPVEQIAKVEAGADAAAMRSAVLPVVHAMADGDSARYRLAMQSLERQAVQHPRPQPESLSAYYDSVQMLKPGSDDTALEQSNEALARIIERDPFANFALVELAQRKLLVPDAAQARALYVQALWASPDQPRAWYGLGVSYLTVDPAMAAACIAIAYKRTRRDTEGEILRTVFRMLSGRMGDDRRERLAAADKRAHAMIDAIDTANAGSGDASTNATTDAAVTDDGSDAPSVSDD